MAVIIAIVVHLVALAAIAFMARWIWKRLPDYNRSRDVVAAMVISLILVAIMFALPHWGFGR
jgi:hypothetical protein